MTTASQQVLIAKTSEVFSPAAPINRRDLFAGRLEQLQRVFDAINTRGQHAVIFGERGVGKTSLANIVQEILSGDYAQRRNAAVVKVNCSKDDGFRSVWQKALDEVALQEDIGESRLGFDSSPLIREYTARRLLPDDPSPNDLRKVLTGLGASIVIFDEFDRVSDGQGLFADTIKTLSDASVDCTLVIVGVAHDIDELIKEHASIDRSLVQILMPRMTVNELHEILNKAMESLGMRMDDDARTLIVLLSQGLPHYTHALGKASTIQALHARRWQITLDDVHASINSAIQNSQQSIRNAYQQATTSPRKDTLFKQVLLACALADVDDLGFFASSDVRDPLSRIMGKRYDIPNFSQHLDKFSSDDRGNVLDRAGTQRRFRFRFSNPLLQPFVIMRGIADGMLKGDLMQLLKRKASEEVP
jgi:Cdc6-like AAA superfamily ATPase